jgi:hypothetical protein
LSSSSFSFLGWAVGELTGMLNVQMVWEEYFGWLLCWFLWIAMKYEFCTLLASLCFPVLSVNFLYLSCDFMNQLVLAQLATTLVKCKAIVDKIQK